MFPHHSLIPWGSFRGRQEEKWGSFRGRDHFRVDLGISSGSGSFRGLYSPRAETRGNLVPRVFAVTTLPRKRRLWGRKWASGRQNIVLFAWRKMVSKNSKNCGTIRISWSTDAIDMLIGGNYPVRVRKLENLKGNKRGIQHTTGKQRILLDSAVTTILCTFWKIMRLPGCWSMPAKDKLESHIFLVLFFHCILAYIYKLGTFVYESCCTLVIIKLIIDKLSFCSAFHKTFDKWFAKFVWNSRSSLRTTSPTSHPSVI